MVGVLRVKELISGNDHQDTAGRTLPFLNFLELSRLRRIAALVANIATEVGCRSVNQLPSLFPYGIEREIENSSLQLNNVSRFCVAKFQTARVHCPAKAVSL